MVHKRQVFANSLENSSSNVDCLQIGVIRILVGFQSCLAMLQGSFVLPSCQLLLCCFEACLDGGHMTPEILALKHA